MKAFGIHSFWKPLGWGNVNERELEILFLIVTIILGSCHCWRQMLEIIWNVTKMSIAFDFVLFVCRWHLSIFYRWLSYMHCDCSLNSSEQQTPTTHSVIRTIKDFLMSFYSFKTIDIGQIAFLITLLDPLIVSMIPFIIYFCPKSIDINENLDWWMSAEKSFNVSISLNVAHYYCLAATWFFRA